MVDPEGEKLHDGRRPENKTAILPAAKRCGRGNPLPRVLRAQPAERSPENPFDFIDNPRGCRNTAPVRHGIEPIGERLAVSVEPRYQLARPATRPDYGLLPA
jgi:hypothetical protein